MLTYMQVPLYYTIPPTIILYLLIRPLLGSFDKIKFIVLCCLALIYTTPWDNYIIYHKAWWYRKDAVIATIGYVPIEEYMFFIIQTLFTAMWTTFCSRWSMNALYLRTTNRYIFYLIRYSVICVGGILMIFGWILAQPATKTFYIGCILWWSLLVILIIWYVAGAYVVKRCNETIIAILVPSIYLCYVDVVALRARVWHINEATSMEIFPVDDLPIEEIIFFFITNIIVALGSHAFDKCKAIIDTYHRDPFKIGENVSPIKRLIENARIMIRSSICNDHTFDGSVVEDLKACIAVLNKASKSFSLAANCFPSDIKQDLTILYAFCRVTDDMVDNEHSIQQKKRQVQTITAFLDQLFANRNITSEYCWKSFDHATPNIDWDYFEQHLSNEQMASFRAIARISYYLPQEPFYELIDGYNWDIEGKAVYTEDDLIEYSKYVASSVATLCTFVFCYKSNRWPDKMNTKCRSMIENARKMGLVLQICNISRDIITDSETLGRCYIPHSYLKKDELEYLVVDRSPNKIPNSQLKIYAQRMLDIANDLSNDAIHAIKFLPNECQRAVLAALEVYQGIGLSIRCNPIYQRRTVLTKWQKIRIMLKCMYFTNLSNLDKRHFKNM